MDDFFVDIGKKNRETLICLLQDNKDTVFGKKHHFSEIHTAEEYRRQVPLADYENFRYDIEQMRLGKNNQLTVYPTAGYCLTTGTEGRRKYIPLTEEELRRFGNHTEMYKDRSYDSSAGKRLVISQFRTVPGERTDDPRLFTEIFYRNLLEKGYMPEENYAGGTELLFQREQSNNFYAKVWIGFSTEDIVQIETIYVYDLLLFFGYMKKNWQVILEDMRQGRIPEERGVAKGIQNILTKHSISPKRYAYVKKICEEGFEKIAEKLWPGLKLISGISHISFKSEDLLLKTYVGDITRNNFVYGSSECLVGICFQENDSGFLLAPGYGFFEFIPYGGPDMENEIGQDEHTCFPEELEAGRMYEIVISNFGGLYRYRLGDVLKVREIMEGIPVLEFAFRKNQALNLAGEKTSIMMIEDVVESIPKEICQIDEYCVGITRNKFPGRYLLAVSSEKKADKGLLTELAAKYDELLAKINVDYADLRQLGHIEPPGVVIMDQNRYRRMLEEQGMLGGHTKPRHITKDGILEDYIL